MWVTHKGHFVQVYRDAATPFQHEGVQVYGKYVYRTAATAGWGSVSRELPLRKAVKYAKAYQQAGFLVRIIERTHNGVTVVQEFSQKRNSR